MLHFVPLICLLTLTAVPVSLDYWCFIRLEVRSFFANFFFFFFWVKIALDTLGPVNFHINFRISWSISSAAILIRIGEC